MRALVRAVCDAGLVRDLNEDMVLAGDTLVRDGRHSATFSVAPEERLCLAVADGVGGMARGEEASQFVLDRLRALVAAIPDDLDNQELAEVFRVFAVESGKALMDGSGSTLAALLFYRGRLYRAHAGDSRLWLFRQGKLSRLTRDHSLRELGGKPEAPANIIVNALTAGGNGYIEFAELAGGCRPADRFLVTTDGLHGPVSAPEIAAALGNTASPAEDVLLAGAKERGGRDNISLLIADIQE